jgi:flagellar basal body P-ring protein FlgI
MSRRTCLLAVAAAALCLTCAGCLPEELSLDPAKDKRPTPPPEVAGTVGEFATLIGGGSLFLDGHGLAVGLGQNGSSEVPPQLKKHLVEYMLKEGVGSALGGARAVMPSRMIADKDTAVVRLAAVVPPGAPKGWKFDVQVTGAASTAGGCTPFRCSWARARACRRARAPGPGPWPRAASSSTRSSTPSARPTRRASARGASSAAGR